MAVELKWQALDAPLDGGICMKVSENTWVTLVYRNKSANKAEPWLLIPIDKSKPQFLQSGGPGKFILPPGRH